MDVSELSGEELVGLVLGPYHIEAVVGFGGMAVVYRALQESIGRSVALKVPRKEFTSDPRFLERFKMEARRSANLEHENILPIYDAGVIEGIQFIAMRYVDGRSLQAILQAHKKLELGEAIRILAAVCAAMDFAHSRKIIHRDLKPSNILIENETGRVFVVDFGISASFDANSNPTLTGMIGTPGYLSPEQIKGTGVSPASDIFAVGALAYQMITGVCPFHGDDQWTILYSTVHEDPPAPSFYDPSIPPEVNDAIMRTIRKNPEDRFACALDFARALGCDQAGWQASVSSRRRPLRNRVRKAIAIAAVTLVLTGLAAAWRPMAKAIWKPTAAYQPSVSDTPADIPAVNEPAAPENPTIVIPAQTKPIQPPALPFEIKPVPQVSAKIQEKAPARPVASVHAKQPTVRPPRPRGIHRNTTKPRSIAGPARQAPHSLLPPPDEPSGPSRRSSSSGNAPPPAAD